MISLSHVLQSWCHFYGNKVMGALTRGPDRWGHQAWNCALQTGLFHKHPVYFVIVTKCTKDYLENSRKLKVQVPDDSVFYANSVSQIVCLWIKALCQFPTVAFHAVTKRGLCCYLLSFLSSLLRQSRYRASSPPTPTSKVGWQACTTALYWWFLPLLESLRNNLIGTWRWHNLSPSDQPYGWLDN